MKYEIQITNQAKKEINKARKQGKNVDLLYKVINLLSEGMQLESKFHDHKLTGKYEGYRECHIEPDFLLIYYIENKILTLYIVRVETHSNLFR